MSPPRTTSSRRAADRKGKELQRLAAAWLRELGCLVEVAHKGVAWIPKKAKLGAPPQAGPPKPQERVPISTRHDLFGLWDLALVWPDGRRGYAQVTTADHVSHKRVAIITSGFPCTAEDMVLGYEGGRGRSFRVLRGPGFKLGKERLTVLTYGAGRVPAFVEEGEDGGPADA